MTTSEMLDTVERLLSQCDIVGPEEVIVYNDKDEPTSLNPETSSLLYALFVMYDEMERDYYSDNDS